jgi:hypothetical protein
MSKMWHVAEGCCTQSSLATTAPEMPHPTTATFWGVVHSLEIML